MNSFGRTSLKVVGIGLALSFLGGCGGMANALGISKSPPDEFAVVKKAPLVMPPDYTLRPPKPGMARPQELQPTQTARQALLGRTEDGQLPQSEGETQLLINANVDRADPEIRSVLDDEGGQLKTKDQAFSDQVLFSEPTKGQAGPLPVADVSSQPLGTPSDGEADAATDESEPVKEKKGFFKRVGGIF